MTRYLAANGQPFTDPDAAAYKAGRMTEESGGRFTVVPIDGGYAVEPDDIAIDADVARDVVEQRSENRSNTPDSATAPITDTPVAADQDPPFVFTLRPAWRAQIAGFFMMLLGALLVVAPTWPFAVFSMDAVYEVNNRMPSIWDDIALGGFGLCFIGIVVILFKRYWQKSVVTNDTVMQSVGVLVFSNISHIDMANVHVVDAKRPNFVHMLLNLGTVELSTPGSAGADVAIVDVVAPKKLANFIRERVSIAKSKRQSRDYL